MSATLHLIRHAQASFGADDYDKLSDLGHRQSEALGIALRRQGVLPDHVFIGAQRRHRETFEGIARGMVFEADPTVLPGLNEFDFKGLLEARFAKIPKPDNLHTDRRTHFRLLRDVVLEWQRDEIDNPPETFSEFEARVDGALRIIEESGAKTPLAVSSGGAIGFSIAHAMGAPASQMILLQLQIKNCAVARYVLAKGQRWLHGFNETPHIDGANQDEMLTYS